MPHPCSLRQTAGSPPRLREGNTSPTVRPMSTSAGSSPRLRETRGALRRRGRHLRLIPALAGNTGCPRGATRTGTAQPRACREHEFSHISGPETLGSSPRARGTLLEAQDGGLGLRLIPASVGNTSLPYPTSGAHMAHPRACGEHGSALCTGVPGTGPSPACREHSSVITPG
jgi:hypothetical protein